jgi:peptide/nickel transport system permease protein
VKRVRQIAVVVLGLILLGSLGAEIVAPTGYATQFREVPNAAPSHAHWLGTDQLGRDRFARLVHGTRISLLLAPAAALFSTLLAAFIGGLAGYLGGAWQRLANAITDLFLCLPWLFLLITARALLPLNVSPLASVTVTFMLLGSLGWAASARVVCADVSTIRNSEFVLQARASGIRPGRILACHVIPNLKPILMAQFLIAIPVFILAEANLGMLGLGVAEPLPSWGSLLRELEELALFSGDYWKLAPLALLIVVVSSFEILLSRSKVNA